MLMFDEITRFSVDIDILLDYENLNTLIGQLEKSKSDVFNKIEENQRRFRGIEKAHYKFYYKSLFSENINYVMLDIVFERPHYKKLLEKEIKASIIDTSKPYAIVRIPSVEDILADKLTAFAPTTVGIRYSDEKYTEIIKQMYDVAKLSRECQNYDEVLEVYKKIAAAELSLRKDMNGLSYKETLDDTIDTCKVILGKGSYKRDYYEKIRMGIEGFTNFISFDIKSNLISQYAAEV